MASEGYHEPPEYLHDETKDLHRAIQSMVEELEAITWYQQRIDATSDPALKEVLAHNRDEEKEHAAMLLEWVRRRDPCFDQYLRTYLFTEAPIPEIEEAVERAGGPEATVAGQENGAPPQPQPLTVGNLMGKQ